MDEKFQEKEQVNMYKKGDKVMFCDAQAHKQIPSCYPKVGTIGVVKCAAESDDEVMVQWPEGSTSSDDLWFTETSQLKPHTTERVIITSKGNEVHRVRISSAGKLHTVARCAPDDTFDFEKGAMIALLRMMEGKVKSV